MRIKPGGTLYTKTEEWGWGKAVTEQSKATRLNSQSDRHGKNGVNVPTIDGKVNVKVMNVDTGHGQDIAWTNGEKTAEKFKEWVQFIFLDHPHEFGPATDVYLDEELSNLLQADSHLSEGQLLYIKWIAFKVRVLNADNGMEELVGWWKKNEEEAGID